MSVRRGAQCVRRGGGGGGAGSAGGRGARLGSCADPDAPRELGQGRGVKSHAWAQRDGPRLNAGRRALSRLKLGRPGPGHFLEVREQSPAPQSQKLPLSASSELRGQASAVGVLRIQTRPGPGRSERGDQAQPAGSSPWC